MMRMVSIEKLHNLTEVVASRTAADNPLDRLPAAMVAELGRLAALLKSDDSVRSVGVIGLRARSGVSSIASMLAVVLAEGGSNVLVLDASPSQSQCTFLHSEAVSRSVAPDSALRVFHTPRAQIQVGTPVNGGLAPLHASLEEAQHTGSMLIVDTPVLGNSLEALAVASAVDRVLLVVEAVQIKKTDVQQAVSTLSTIKARIGGVLVNRVPGSLPTRRNGKP